MNLPDNDNKDLKNIVKNDFLVYESREALEDARLRAAINRPDIEKFKMFTRLMRIGIMLKRAKITHKPE